MKQPNYLKYIYLFMGMFGACLMIIAALVILVDPFFQYHKPLNGLYYTIDNQLEQNPGMAKRFDYDSVILGSSMTVNFNPDLFADTMGLQTLKLSSNAAYPKDIDNIMKIIKDREMPIRNIFLGIDIFTYKHTPGITAYELPEHLYDNNLLNDVSYIFNKDVILSYIVAPQIKRESTPLNEIYYTWPHMKYGTDYVMASFSGRYKGEGTFAVPIPADSYRDNIEQGLEQYILPYIESMPDTEFDIFFPPYSILYWFSRMEDGTVNAELQSTQQIVEILLEYPNVNIYYFQNQYEYITNLDNYCDYTHYYNDMNDYMTQCFADGSNKLTKENYREVLEDMTSFVLNYDYEGGILWQ